MADAAGWIRVHVEPVGEIETAYDRPWARVSRVPTRTGVVWFKECAPVQGFEPRLSAHLSTRWPDRVAEVLAHDEDRRWLLLRDAGTHVGALGNPPQAWLTALPAYAELQRGEAEHAEDHVRNGVPDLRLATLPARYQELVAHPLPVSAEEQDRMRRLVGPFAAWCEELADAGIPESVQHDDLHMNNLFVRDDVFRVIDWGDSSVSHPFASLVVTFRFLEERNGLAPADPWFDRLRDAYLEPWGRGLRDTFTLALCVGSVAHAVARLRQRTAMPSSSQPDDDDEFALVLRRALEKMSACPPT
jgi:hypothetical protein